MIVDAWKRWARALKRQTFVLYYAWRNPGTPWYAKAWTAMVVAYAFSPIDLIPDFIPVLGYLDDLVLIPLGIFVAMRLIPRHILEDSRRLADERMSSKRPVSWAGAIVIAAIWLAVLVVVAFLVVRAIGKRRG